MRGASTASDAAISPNRVIASGAKQSRTPCHCERCEAISYTLSLRAERSNLADSSTYLRDCRVPLHGTRNDIVLIKAVLERNGSSLDEVVKCTVMIEHIDQWGEVNEVYRTYFPNHFPACRAHGADGLGGGQGKSRYVFHPSPSRS